MEIFVVVKKVLTMLGILAIEGHCYGPVIRTLLTVVTVLAQLYAILTIGWFLTFGAQTFVERAEAAHIVSAVIYSEITFYIVWSHRDTLMGFLGTIQRIAEERKTLPIPSSNRLILAN